ncbi:hypothetical protein Vretifemale_19038 [Volvox reticuliferus]|uniref:Uncharacterized protein n=2 Tax=Volvox reticuliferus TaxID=1737510 RepID=A0A8J4CWW7_9CHLO|nr:hypothetical protein Vretifemale_19038 [Volvox reticuliferus]
MYIGLFVHSPEAAQVAHIAFRSSHSGASALAAERNRSGVIRIYVVIIVVFANILIQGGNALAEVETRQLAPTAAAAGPSTVLRRGCRRSLLRHAAAVTPMLNEQSQGLLGGRSEGGSVQGL